MKHQEGYFKTSRADNVYYQYWVPDQAPKAILLIAHGLAEHSGRYMNLVNYFVPLGYAVYGLDHIGHGKSDGKRVYVERFQEYLTPIKTYLDMVHGLHPEKPVFLVGHSMGGLIAAAFLLEHQDDLSGAILSGPGIKIPDHISSFLIFAGKLFSLILPKAGISQLGFDGISRDPAVVDAYVHDPLVYTGKITARLAAEMIKTMDHVTKTAGTIRLPIMIAQGSCDTLVDPGGAHLLHDLVGSEDKTLKVYDGLYHEIFNEPEHKQVLKDVEHWVEGHMQAPVHSTLPHP